MKRLFYTFATFTIVVIAFTATATMFSEASAATIGETRTVTGTLEDHDNDAYTHKVDGYNLILKEEFNDWSGKTVKLTVVYTTATKFKISSISKVEATAAVATTTTTSGNTRTVTGTLEKHTNDAYTHKVGAYNLILDSSNNDMEGKTVTLSVMYTSATKFKVTSIALASGTAPTVGSVSSAATFTGTLTLSPRASRDYRITSSTGAYVDILTSTNYDGAINKTVEMTYSGTLSSFRMLGLVQK